MEAILEFALQCFLMFFNADEPRRSIGACLIAAGIILMVSGAIALASGMVLSSLVWMLGAVVCIVAISAGGYLFAKE